MDANLKKILKAVTLELRHSLEGRYDNDGNWKPGDLELRLAAIGVRRDREPKAVDELPHLQPEDLHARKVVDAYLQLREEAEVSREHAVGEFLRETAYTWANRLLALRCMEARELIDEAILQKEVYGGRSLEHHRLAQREPELCTGEDDGRFAMLDRVFAKQAEHLPMLFDPQAPGVALRPSPAALKRCMALLSGTETVRSHDPATSEVFTAPDALGWAYQYWNTEEKDRVFEKVRTVKGAKIEGADIVPATQLYTESYMVQFLVQNSLGATWMGMHPDSKLYEQWDYYVRDADRASVERRPVRELTFLDPACGSGHFLLEAFDLLYAMYEEEGELTEPDAICDAILTQNLYGIDIDARSVQIAEAALWMKAAERAFDYEGVPTNLVAAVSSHLKGPHWEEFLTSFKKEPSVPRVLRKFGESMEHIDELGSLARPNEELKNIIAGEHALWEQQVREKKEANYLFPEMRKEALSGKLAFKEITDEEFGDRLFYRARAALDMFTEQARERGDFQDQLLGHEATTGFRLLDVLGRRYAVINANPPYMGSKNFAPVLKDYTAKHYESAKRDLYATFIARSIELGAAESSIAMVTQQSWLFLNSYSKLRSSETSRADGLFAGVLHETAIESLVHLGRYAFSEIGNAAVAPVLFVLRKCQPSDSHHVWSCRLSQPRPSETQAQLTRDAAQGVCTHLVSRPKQIWFLEVPNSPVCYWLQDRFFDLLSGPKLRDVAIVKKGLATLNNDRFIRFFWEVDGGSNKRWRRLAKAGTNVRWRGGRNRLVEWEHDGSRVKECVSAAYGGVHWSKEVRSPELYFRKGLCYSIMSQGALCVRDLTDEIFENKTGAIFGADDLQPLLNTRLASFFMRVLASGLEFNTGTVELMPIPHREMEWHTANDLKSLLVRSDPLEWTFNSTTLPSSQEDWATAVSERILEDAGLSATICAIEAANEQSARTAFNLTDREVGSIEDETGVPAGLLPLVRGLDPAPRLNTEAGNCVPRGFEPPACEYRELSAAEIKTLANRIKAELFDANGEGQDNDDEILSEDEVATGRAVPPQSTIEGVANSVGYHPFTVFSLLADGIESGGWRSTEIEKRYLVQITAVTILRLVGYRWPCEPIESSVIPDADGIIPVTELSGTQNEERGLVERIRSQFVRSSGNRGLIQREQSFEELLGKTLNVWVNTEFFRFHSAHFKKRPIVWQIQSGTFTQRHHPGYACIISFHELDGDLIRKVRKQAEDVRKSFETELRSIASTPADSRSDRQEERRVELDDGIEELRRFDATLAQLATSGFGPQSLVPELRQYAIDDAMLALKRRWLKRLSSLVTDSTLSDWQADATKAEIHEDLPHWIGHAVTNLQHHCATIGIEPPKVNNVGDDLTSADLGPLICAKAADMLTGSLKCACDVWWKQFDDTVLGPLKEDIKQKKAERKDIKEQLAADPPPSPDEGQALTLRDKQVRDEIKPLDARVRRLKAIAQRLRQTIQSWKNEEALTWEDWLSGEPLFDEVTSLDGHRPAPNTIADFIAQESAYVPDINDGVRVNIAPLQKAGLLAAEVLARKDVDKAIADRAEWRADERRWVREGKLPQPGWWPEEVSREA